MNKQIMKIVSLLCVTALLMIPGLNSLAATPELNAVVNLYAYADPSQDVLDITVYPDESDAWVTVVIAKENGLPLKYYQVKAAQTNNIQFSLVGLSSSEDIVVRISANPSGATKDYTQRYYSYSEQQQAMRDIMNPSIAITQEIADKISLRLDGDFALLNASAVRFLKSQLTATFGDMPNIVITDFITELTNNIRLSVLNSRDSAIIKNYLERDKVSLGLSELAEYAWYSEYSDAERTSKITEMLARKSYATVADFVNEFKAQNYLQVLSEKHSSALISFARTNSANQPTLTLDWAGYDALQDFQKEYFANSMVGTRHATLASLQSAFAAKLTEAATYTEDSGEISGGNQQGGGSLGTVTGGFGGGVSGGVSGGIGGGTGIPTPGVSDSVVGKFKDVSSVPWAHEAIKALSDRGVINGVDGENFAPEGIVTKEQFVKIIVGAFDIKGANAENKFSDVAEGEWYSEFIKIAVENGIVNGVSENSFGIGTNISRQDMAVIVYRVANKYGINLAKNTEAVPADIEGTADYAKEAVTALYQAGIINGVGGGNFAPGEIATRAQAAKIIYELWRMM